MEDFIIRVNGLKKYFGSIKAVDDISFEIEKGTIFGMLGPNGLSNPEIFCGTMS